MHGDDLSTRKGAKAITSEYLCIDMFNQLVHVLVPEVGILILEIRAHCHDNVVGAIVLGLQGTVLRIDKLISSDSPTQRSML